MIGPHIWREGGASNRLRILRVKGVGGVHLVMRGVRGEWAAAEGYTVDSSRPNSVAVRTLEGNFYARSLAG